MEIKIGIVLNYKNAEKKKDELFKVNSRDKDYLKLANNPEFKKYCIIKNGKRYVPADIAIGLYIMYYFNNKSDNKSDNKSNYKFIIDYITPDEISTSRFKKNNIVFIVIYDLLEAFHLTNRSNFYKFKKTLKECNNVYPPYEYQKFINNKCTYYKYLSQKNIPVAPTHCITKNKWNTRDSDQYTNKILKKIKNNKWDSFITKPVYGQESKDFAKFICDSDCKKSNCQRDKLKKYFSKNIPKYKSIIIQEYIPGFDKENPEIRTYFINGEYRYSIITTKTLVEKPYEEGGKYHLPPGHWEYIMRFSKKVMSSLPKLNLPGIHQNPILTRIDIGSGLHGVHMGYFVNEVEFVPSLYIEDQKYPVVEEIAESLLPVALEYSKMSNKKIKVIF